jgi:hypothetical protein
MVLDLPWARFEQDVEGLKHQSRNLCSGITNDGTN